MENIISLDSINRENTFRYLGYKGNVPEKNIIDIIDKCEKELLEAMKPRYIYEAFDIEKNYDEQSIQVIGTSLVLTGHSITNHLKDCNKVILLCATVSEQTDRFIRIKEIEDMTQAVIADTLASVAVDEVCDKAEEMIKSEYKDYYQTWRYGIGYGDLPITLQKNFLDVLNASKRIGVMATTGSILTPRKSITCIIGLSKEPVQQDKRGCNTCNLKGKCTFRKRGEHCGF